MAGPLADSSGAAAGAGAPALERRSLVREASGHEELVGIEAVVVEGVRRCGAKQLADDRRHLSVAVLEDLRGSLKVLVPDEVEDLARLVGGHARVPENRSRPRPLVGLDARHVNAFPLVPG